MMAPMLVAAERVATPVGKSARAVATLSVVDPEFVEFCKMLYGDDVDPADVWRDAFAKMEPTGADLSTPGEQRKLRQRARRVRKFESRDSRNRALTAGASAIGAGAGGLGFAAGVKEWRNARRAGRPMSKLGRGLLVVEPIGLAGEVGATRILHGDVKRKQQAPVTKAFGMPGMKKLKAGLVTGMRRHAPPVNQFAQGFKGTTSNLTAGAQKAPSTKAGGIARTAVNPLVSSTPRKIATATGGGLLAGHMAGKRKNGNGGDQGGYPQMPYPPSPFVGKRDAADVVWEGEFTKFDEDKRLVFGWASVSEINGMPIVDRQGDWIDPDDLADASYRYVMKSRVGGDMHRRAPGDTPLKTSDLVESMVFTKEKVAKMGLPEDTPLGWWVGFKVHDESQWQMVKKRLRTGFSIHGRGKRIEKSMDDLVPGYS